MLRICIGFVTILAIAATLGYFWLHTGLPRYDGRLTLRGLNDSVTIIRDRLAIPHIFAQTESDAYFALGFVHAQDRLWQMEMVRRLGAGRLTELFGTLFGDTFLNIDRFIRTLGLYRRLEVSMQSMQPQVQQSAVAYAAGVNAYLSQRPTLPIEFQLLWHEPEPWQPTDSFIWAKLMAMRLSGNFRDELSNLRLRHLLPPEAIDDLFPEGIDQFPTTLTHDERESVRQFAGRIEQVFSFLGTMTASNAWVLGGSRTATDMPILANDPHLNLDGPILWYLARIVTPQWTLTGATVPGTPLHVLGHNGTIAWGMTTNHSDTQDLFMERLSATNPNHYQTPEGSLPFSIRHETIDVRWGNEVSLTIRETRHGPVISDLFPETLVDRELSGLLLSLQATMLSNNDTSVQAIYALNRAKNWNDFLTAMARFQTPQQNVFYADTSGTIGFLSAGLIPIRRNGEGLIPVPGWTGHFDWTEPIPFEELPQSVDPVSGFLANANNAPVGTEYEYLLAARWPPAYRAQRIQQYFDQMRTGHTLTSNSDLQLDAVSLLARALVPVLTSISPPSDVVEAQAFALMQQWDGTMDRHRPQPLIYTAWMRHLYDILFMLPSDRTQRVTIANWPEVIRRILTDQTQQEWCSWRKPADSIHCSLELTDSFHKSIQGLTQQFGNDPRTWRWGDVHIARFDHPLLSRIPGLGDLFYIGIETDGDNDTVNRGSMPGLTKEDRSYNHTHGAGYRAVYDLSDLDRSRFIIATGQSGNPLSPHYQDFVTLWRDGNSVEIAGDLETLSKIGMYQLVLEPRDQ